MNVFRAVQSAVAHDSLLKSVLSEEKDVIDALRKLAAENQGASKALADWGVRDGDDLGVILTHMQTLNDKLSSYISTYADKVGPCLEQPSPRTLTHFLGFAHVLPLLLDVLSTTCSVPT